MNPKVLIVEDKVIVAEDIKEILESNNCTVSGIATSGEMALRMYTKERPDIILMDLRLNGNYNGIETSAKILEKDEVPIIYLTAHSDSTTLNAALQTNPANYLVKPFDEKDLRIALRLAMNTSFPQTRTNFLSFRHKGIMEKIPINEILYAKANGSYTIVYTSKKQYTASFNLNQFLQKVTTQFVRIHRSYVVNKTKIHRYTSKFLFIGSLKVPISRSYRKEIASII